MISCVGFNTASGKCCCNDNMLIGDQLPVQSFNTASGKCCCNGTSYVGQGIDALAVSIPQAVSAVATTTKRDAPYLPSMFQYRKR